MEKISIRRLAFAKDANNPCSKFQSLSLNHGLDIYSVVPEKNKIFSMTLRRIYVQQFQHRISIAGNVLRSIMHIQVRWFIVS